MITSRFVCMVNLNCILAIFPEWGQKVPPYIINKGFKGKITLPEQHLDGDISNAYLAIVHGRMFSLWNSEIVKFIYKGRVLRLCRLTAWGSNVIM